MKEAVRPLKAAIISVTAYSLSLNTFGGVLQLTDFSPKGKTAQKKIGLFCLFLNTL